MRRKFDVCIERRKLWRVHADQHVKDYVEAVALRDVVLDVRGNASFAQEVVPEVVALALQGVRRNVEDVVIVVQIVLPAPVAAEAACKHVMQYVVVIAVDAVDVADVEEHAATGARDALVLVLAAKHAADVLIHVLVDVLVHVMWDAAMDVNLHVCHRVAALALKTAQGSLQHQ